MRRFLTWRGWTKRHRIVCTRTSKRTRSVVVGVTIRSRASRLEHCRVHGRPARRRRAICAAATVLGAVECLTRALTRISLPRSELLRALPVQIGNAPGRSTQTRPARPFHDHRNIVPIHKTDVVKILPSSATTERELGESDGRRCASAVALELAGATVSRDTGAGSVEVTTGSCPEAAGPASGSKERAGSIRGELKSGSVEASTAGISEDSGPDGVVTSVDECESGSVNCRRNEIGRAHV